MDKTTANSKATKADYRNARKRMAQFISAATGAKLDDDVSFHDDCIVASGNVLQIEIARAHFANVLMIDGVTADEPMADDPEWTCLRIPMGNIAAAIAKHETCR